MLAKEITPQVLPLRPMLDSRFTQFTYDEVHDTNFALMPEMLKLELLIKTFSSSGTCFSILKLTVTSLSAVLKATKYPGLPLLILKNKCHHLHKSTHNRMCARYTIIFMATSYHIRPSCVYGSFGNWCNEIKSMFSPKI